KGTGAAVLLLHAGIADRSMWNEHLDWLADAGFRAIAVDLPGFGDAVVSGGMQAPWEDVLQTLRELAVPRAVLVGDSFGAAVALRAAVVAPAAVSGLMLVSPPPLRLEPSPALSAAWDAENAALERGDVEAAIAAVVEAWLAPDAPAALRERVASMQRRAFVLQSAIEDAEAAPDPLEAGRTRWESCRSRFWPWRAKLTCPTSRLVRERSQQRYRMGGSRSFPALVILRRSRRRSSSGKPYLSISTVNDEGAAAERLMV
ncbi:MAG: alpha/beta hydrolase, partial [Solirubrobacteraceae bacterium]